MHKERNHVVLVDSQNNELGTMDKYEAHTKGVLHRAFSIFIFNEKGELLLQQRANEKYHGADLWTNTCCSHQQLHETTTQAANDRLAYEMNIQADMEELFSFVYHAQVENSLIEHELDFVLFGITNQNPQPNTEEVQAYKWMGIDELEQWMTDSPEEFTYWFKDAWYRVKEHMLEVIETNSYKKTH